MSGKWISSRGLVIVAAALLAAGCGATGTPAPTVHPTLAPAPAPSATPAAVQATADVATPREVTVTADVQFAAAPPSLVEWSPPRLDVYAPAGASGLPLVVMLPPHSLAKEDAPAFAQLAKAVAERGAVAIVANWSQLEDPPDVFANPASVERIAALGQSVAGCAVSYAVSHAADFGADPSRLVLVGELYGANAAAMTALGRPKPFAGCASTTAWKATGLVGLDGDWLVSMPAWDGLGPGVGRALAALSPFPSLGAAPKIPVALVVADQAVELTSQCDGADAARIESRDPSGVMRAGLEKAGALRDACVDLGEAAQSLAKEMVANGLEASVVPLPNADGETRAGMGGQIQEFGSADLALLAKTVLDVAGSPR
jgi:hypothetical protein